MPAARTATSDQRHRECQRAEHRYLSRFHDRLQQGCSSALQSKDADPRDLGASAFWRALVALEVARNRLADLAELPNLRPAQPVEKMLPHALDVAWRRRLQR